MRRTRPMIASAVVGVIALAASLFGFSLVYRINVHNGQAAAIGCNAQAALVWGRSGAGYTLVRGLAPQPGSDGTNVYMSQSVNDAERAFNVIPGGHLTVSGNSRSDRILTVCFTLDGKTWTKQPLVNTGTLMPRAVMPFPKGPQPAVLVLGYSDYAVLRSLMLGIIGLIIAVAAWGIVIHYLRSNPLQPRRRTPRERRRIREV